MPIRRRSRRGTRVTRRNSANTRGFTERLYEALDGKTVTHQGISGVIRCRPIQRAWGVEHRLDHIPDAKGRRTEAYRSLKRQLGDDWSSDLSSNDDFGVILDIARRKGIDVDELARAAGVRGY
jgi:hypothetical protein